jgi:predicted metal-dependent hydrolase
MTDTSENGKTSPAVRIVRSRNRKRTVAGRLVEGGAVLEILAPVHISDAELAPIIEKLRRRVEKQGERPGKDGDSALARRAAELNRQYFDGKLRWSEVRYVTNQNHRYGSCTPVTGRIRLSHRLTSMPTWVRDYVLVHEMAHLVEPNHGPRFWKLVNRYPLTERARGYLMALGMESEGDEPDENDVQ